MVTNPSLHAAAAATADISLVVRGSDPYYSSSAVVFWLISKVLLIFLKLETGCLTFTHINHVHCFVEPTDSNRTGTNHVLSNCALYYS